MNEKELPLQVQPDEIRHKMNQWRQANPQATLTEIEEAVEAELAQLRTQLVEAMVQEAAADAQEIPDCPQCGQPMVKNGRRKRKLKSKEGQTIEIERQQWRCLTCEATHFPLDRALGLLAGAYTPQVQEAITRLSSRMPYREACVELGLLWKVEISAGGMRHITMRHGRVADTLIGEKMAQLEATAPVPTAKPEQIVMCTDGAMVQLTTGEWREVKTVSFGEFQPHWDVKERKVVTQTDQVSYFSRVESAEAFSRLALVEWHRRGGDNAHTVVAVQDGAVWIQSFIDYHCPQAIRVIDFAHAQEYVAVVGRAIHGAETDAFRQWYGRMSRQLGQQAPQRTVNELRLLQRQHFDHPAGEVIESAIRYLEKRVPMIDYPHFRRQQIPIGSGIVESGHKVVMQSRMKQAGMRWAEANLNPMLALRVTLCNQRWKESWQEIEAKVRQERYPRYVQPKRSPAPIAKPQIVTEADCQRMTALAEKIAKQKRQPWQDNRWVFPNREHLIHQN